MKVYICDGSEQSFYTALYFAVGTDARLTSARGVQLGFGTEITEVVPDPEKCRLITGAIDRIDRSALHGINLVLRSCDENKEQIAFEYANLLLQKKSSVRSAYGYSAVTQFEYALKKVTLEAHRFTGFLRFKESAQGIFYAPYSPDNDVTDLLMPHFCARFNGGRFVIHDVKRGKAGIYNGEKWILCAAGEAEIELSDCERNFEKLWQKYYESVNIKERPHEKQMRGSMPARYWKFLPEKKV